MSRSSWLRRAGAAAVKLFPASALGPQFVREMRGPLPEIGLVPTGTGPNRTPFALPAMIRTLEPLHEWNSQSMDSAKRSSSSRRSAGWASDRF